MNRRGLLKLFGAGAIVAPLLGDVAVKEAAAVLIEEPKVELVEPRIVRLYDALSPVVYKVTVERVDAFGDTLTFEAHKATLTTEPRVYNMKQHAYPGNEHKVMTGVGKATIDISFECHIDGDGQLGMMTYRPYQPLAS